MRIKSTYLALLAVLLSPMAANADLIKVGDIVSDTDADLDWFTMTATTNISWDDMQANFADASSQFFGFRYAIADDLMALWGNAGYTGDFFGVVTDTASMDAIQHLFDLFGQTGTDCCARSDGRYDDGDGGSVGLAFLIPDYDPGESLGRFLPNWFSTSDQNWDESGENSLGSWIIRDSVSVPEPSTLALFGIGLFGMGLARRKKV